MRVVRKRAQQFKVNLVAQKGLQATFKVRNPGGIQVRTNVVCFNLTRKLKNVRILSCYVYIGHKTLIGNSLDKLRHTRSVAYSVELVLPHKHQISGGGAHLDCYPLGTLMKRRRYVCCSRQL